MCGGVGFKIKNISDSELKKYYSPELIKRFKEQDKIESFFWYKQAVLPVKRESKIELHAWGNKDSKVKLPKTGWAKEESLKQGKWNYLHPEIVDLPVDSGYEKKIWFDFLEGTKGILVKNGKDERVYMITREASDEYREKTGHDRMPPGVKSNYRE
jgi:hypothetical protein